MYSRTLLFALLPLIFIACKKERDNTPPPPPPPPPPAPTVLLKEINIPNLPSPYYSLEYNTSGQVKFASFASGFISYDFIYNGNLLDEMRANNAVNKDRLRYGYDHADNVVGVGFADATGFIYRRMLMTYSGQKLIKLERERREGNNFVPEKEVTFTYYPDGNLERLSEHHFPSPFNGNLDFTITDLYENYDDKINVDAFKLLHTEFASHLVLLPRVQLQKNNPGRVTRTGYGTHYEINYTYSYNTSNAPTESHGAGKFLNGNNAGQTFQSNVFYTYY
jgi:hypothetical protein